MAILCAQCGTSLPDEANYCLQCGRPTRRPTRVFAIANQRGRVGKTTTAVDLCACLADSGWRILLIDLCPTAAATLHLGLDPHKAGNTMYEQLVNEGFTVEQVIKRDVRPNLALLPAKVDLYAAEIEVVYLDQREYRLRRALEPVTSKCDFILIDCPPSLGLLTVNALCAADGVIVPLQCEYFALEGLTQLLKTIKLVRDELNPTIGLFGIALTMYHSDARLSAEVVQEISEHFPKERFTTVIPRDLRLAEAPSYGVTILEHDPGSPGALAYKLLAEEVVARATALGASQA
ncbi:MAG TPA: AAA family ATPase [Ktedonobacterales bacterium]|nr:AAA family ATPase [Ktedonobacterales bacterium]